VNKWQIQPVPPWRRPEAFALDLMISGPSKARRIGIDLAPWPGTMSAHRPIALLCFAVAFLGVVAQASARPRHERIKIAPWKENGTVVGIKLKLTLRPANEGRTVVRIGLGDMSMRSFNWQKGRDRVAKGDYLAYQWPEITGLAQNGAKEVELKVRYSDAPKLKPGTQVEVVSAWNNAAQNQYWHIWGLQAMTRDATMVVTLPQAPSSAQAKPKKPAATAQAKPAQAKPKKPAATAQAKPKKPAATAQAKPKRPAATAKPKKPAATAAARVRANLRQSSASRASTTRSRATTTRAPRTVARASRARTGRAKP